MRVGFRANFTLTPFDFVYFDITLISSAMIIQWFCVWLIHGCYFLDCGFLHELYTCTFWFWLFSYFFWFLPTWSFDNTVINLTQELWFLVRLSLHERSHYTFCVWILIRLLILPNDYVIILWCIQCRGDAFLTVLSY